MELQAETLFTHDPLGRICETNEPGARPAPRFFLGRTRHGNLWRFRGDLPGGVIRRLDALASSEPVTADLREPPVHLAGFREALGEHGQVRDSSSGPAYRFPDDIRQLGSVVHLTEAHAALFTDRFEWLIREVSMVQPCVAVVSEGIAVSVCFSARFGPRAAEAGVETREGFRGRGFATRAVAGWAIAVRELGRLPLYSTSWENLASQGVARRLGLVLYGADLSLT
jgi:RimJ/RimL family protein N-acetyltransferase